MNTEGRWRVPIAVLSHHPVGPHTPLVDIALHSNLGKLDEGTHVMLHESYADPADLRGTKYAEGAKVDKNDAHNILKAQSERLR